MVYLRIMMLFVLFTISNISMASGMAGIFNPILFEGEESSFVLVPAKGAGIIGGVAGAVVGIPIAIIGGTITTFTSGDPMVGAGSGMIVCIYSGYQIISNIVAAPLWTVKAIFYDFPQSFVKNEQTASNDL